MHASYTCTGLDDLPSPALLFYRDLIQANIDHAVKMVGDPSRLRPHVKTHKTREIARMQKAAGITKHKCATIAEAELLAMAGIDDVLLAYPIVGPNCKRVAALVAKYPTLRLSVLADHPATLGPLAEAVRSVGKTVTVLLDIDVGQHRTGIAVGPEATALYERIAATPGLVPGGLHAYDGHNHQETLADRTAAAQAGLAPVLEMRKALLARGFPVPRLVVGGTPTYPVYAGWKDLDLECSPGTCSLYDAGYGSRFAEMADGFTPAAVLLTRVVSRPTATRVTFDLGTKAIASDPLMAKRVHLLNVPAYEIVGHNEEHLIIETPDAAKFTPGDLALALPWHVCPTVALHRQAVVVAGGKMIESWDIIGRDRKLTV
jgi:D-serine deaminase-like pyridoxal phosphate-dependent protein